MTKDQRLLVEEKVSAEIAKIEREAMGDVASGLEYLAQCSDIGRDSAMSALLAGQPMKLDRWRALRMAQSELLCHSS
jgi:hypothetical protein